MHRTTNRIFIILVSLICCAVPLFAGGQDFIDEAKLIYRAAACGQEELPAGYDAALIENHCRCMNRMSDQYRKAFIDKARPFMAAIVQGAVPKEVVVPFGGGDLLPAMIVYPDAKEYTTISLESAGDPRRLSKATATQLKHALEMFRSNAGYMLVTNDNSNESVRNMDRGFIPNQLAFALTALALLGYEPVSLKYFRIEDDGSLHYLTRDEITSLEPVKGQRLKGTWIDTDFSVAFRNMELTFRKRGGGPAIIHRHIAFNLDNGHFSGSGLLKHMESKGKVSVMIKGASYLPWFDNFSSIRDYVLSHGVYIVSDSTGILPRHAEAAGFEQITYGKFNGAFLKDNGGSGASMMRVLFQSQPYREMPFRFGYSDIHRSNHMIITKLKKY